MDVTCPVCPHHCVRAPEKHGLCRARVNRGGEMIAENYGRVTALALDPVEKKPFYHFHPGHNILSVGSYGCNLRCSFCQNASIAQEGADGTSWRELSAEALVRKAIDLKSQKNIGIAFSYNEPSVGWEYLRDVSALAAREGLVCAMVTNGYFCSDILQQLLPGISAFNIDLKCFTESGYKRLHGTLGPVKETIARAVESAHVEITTLIVPGLSDSAEDMEKEAAWLASLSPDIPLHLSRYFPQYRMDAPPTDPRLIQQLAEVAKKHLNHVHLGNL